MAVDINQTSAPSTKRRRLDPLPVLDSSNNIANATSRQIVRNTLPPPSRQGHCVAGIAELYLSQGLEDVFYRLFANGEDRLPHFLNLDWNGKAPIFEIRLNKQPHDVVLRIIIPKTEYTVAVRTFYLNHLLCIDRTSNEDPVSCKPWLARSRY